MKFGNKEASDTEIHVKLNLDQHRIRANTGDGSPAAVAQQVLTIWAAAFGDAAPRKR